MTAAWKSEYEEFRNRRVKDEFVYMWVDGVHFEAKYPKAVASLTDNHQRMSTFFASQPPLLLGKLHPVRQ